MLKKEKLELFEINEKTNKEIMLQIINLYNKINESDILKDINDKLIEENEDCKIENNNIRVKSLKKELNKTKYIKKTTFQNFALYVYKSYTDIFIKNNENIEQDFFDELKNESINLNGDIIIFIDGKKKILINKDSETKEETILKYIKNNINTTIKIKISYYE